MSGNEASNSLASVFLGLIPRLELPRHFQSHRDSPALTANQMPIRHWLLSSLRSDACMERDCSTAGSVVGDHSQTASAGLHLNATACQQIATACQQIEGPRFKTQASCSIPDQSGKHDSKTVLHRKLPAGRPHFV